MNNSERLCVWHPGTSASEANPEWRKFRLAVVLSRKTAIVAAGTIRTGRKSCRKPPAALRDTH